MISAPGLLHWASTEIDIPYDFKPLIIAVYFRLAKVVRLLLDIDNIKGISRDGIY